MPASDPSATPLTELEALDDAALDRLEFGVIGFTPLGLIDRYNRAESINSGLSPQEVMGRSLFGDVAQCMSNALVAQRFADAQNAGTPLDVTLDYLFTFHMRPTPVRLRLLGSPAVTRRYLIVQRA